jgi:hypothetical protein
VVRIDGFDTETRRKRPWQLGTYDSRRAARAAAVQVADSGPRRRIGERRGGLSTSGCRLGLIPVGFEHPPLVGVVDAAVVDILPSDPSL